jgi:integrase
VAGRLTPDDALAGVVADDVADDVADLAEFLDGTGMRIGQALAVRAEVVDLDAGVIEVNATVVRLKGKGSVIQRRPKTAAGWRIIAAPPHVVALCRRRLALTWARNPSA